MLYLGQAFRQWRFRWDSIAWRTLRVGEQLLKFLSIASRSYMFFCCAGSQRHRLSASQG